MCAAAWPWRINASRQQQAQTVPCVPLMCAAKENQHGKHVLSDVACRLPGPEHQEACTGQSYTRCRSSDAYVLAAPAPAKQEHKGQVLHELHAAYAATKQERRAQNHKCQSVHSHVCGFAIVRGINTGRGQLHTAPPALCTWRIPTYPTHRTQLPALDLRTALAAAAEEA